MKIIIYSNFLIIWDSKDRNGWESVPRDDDDVSAVWAGKDENHLETVSQNGGNIAAVCTVYSFTVIHEVSIL